MNDLATQSSQPKSYIQIKVGSGFYRLSDREQLLCDTYLKTFNIAECKRVFEKKYRGVSCSTIKRWMETRSHIREYLREKVEQMADANMSKEEYVSKIRRLAEGDVEMKKTTPFFWKLLGEAKGFLESEESTGLGNIEIKILQANGRE